jgi:hypothetical protein
MQFKQLGAFSAAVGMAFVFSSSAWAASTSENVTFPTPLNELPLFGVELPSSNKTRTVAAGDTFSDTYTFSLTQASDVFGGVSSPLAVRMGMTVKGVTFDSITLASTVPGSGFIASGTSLPEFTFEGLAIGSYQLTIAGRAIGSQGGFYTGELVAVSAVPEPTTTALALSALAIVGGLSLRRKA